MYCIDKSVIRNVCVCLLQAMLHYTPKPRQRERRMAITVLCEEPHLAYNRVAMTSDCATNIVGSQCREPIRCVPLARHPYFGNFGKGRFFS